ncbi:MAG: PKD domain-containing protein [Balneolales bacterium]|nr:PKD domain-containing protein [Balneolales bacterium]
MRFGHLLVCGLLGLVVVLLPAGVNAQEIYFSISGQSVRVSSGDTQHQYDYWFRPKEGVTNPRQATVEIFDAGLGGIADVIAGEPDTRTTYAFYAFDTLYTLGDRQLLPLTKEESAIDEPLSQTIAFNESRFLNRWVTFYTLDAQNAVSEEGFIMRVSTDGGNDVNDFRIRITGEGAEDWELITLNLSVGLISSSPGNLFQFMPLWNTNEPPEFVVAGQEDSRVYLMNAFGQEKSLDESDANFLQNRNNKENYWAVLMTGSSIRINNRLLRGRDEIVPFRTNFITLNDSRIEAPQIRVRTSDRDCQEYGLEADYRGFSLDMREARWETDGETFTGPSFLHAFSGFGSFPYRFVAPITDRHVPGYKIMEGTIRVNQPPVIQLDGIREIVSPGEVVQLDASGSADDGGGPLSYRWFVNDEFRSGESSFRFSNSVSGLYQLRLTVSDNQPEASCTESSKTFTVRVNTQPYAEIDYRSVIAKDEIVTVAAVNAADADGDRISFSWSGPGILGASEGSEIQLQHSQPGDYSIRLTADDNTGTRNATYSTTVNYKVNAAPVPEFTTPAIIAPGDMLTLNASRSTDPDGDPLTFSWDVSDGRNLTGQSREILFEEPGLYEITLTVDDGENVSNSVQALTREILVNAPPIANISAEEQVNTPVVWFDGSGSSDEDQSIVSWEWDFGDGVQASGERVMHTFPEQGVYTVRLVVDDGTGVGNARQSATHQIRVNKNPVASFTAPSITAPEEPILLDGSASMDEDGEITSWHWFLNGKEIGTGESLETMLPDPGLYTITLKVRDDSPFEDAVDNAFRQIRVNHAPVPRWKAEPSVTEPGKETFFDASFSTDADNENLEFEWIFEDDVVLRGSRVSRTFSESGSYWFTLRVDDGENMPNSIQEKEGYIRVNLPPIIVTETSVRSNSRTVFLDASDSYNPDGDQLSFRWILPDGTVEERASFRLEAPETGIHTLSLQVDDNEGLGNSVSTERVAVMINKPPVAIVDESIATCTDQLIIFTSARSFDPDGDSFTTRWEFGDGATSNEANPVHSYSRPGIFTARVFLDDGFAEEETVQEIPVTVEGSPQAIMKETELTVCANSPVVFDGSASTDPSGVLASYSWDFGDMNSASGPVVTHLFSRPGTYRVLLTVSGSGSGNCPNSSQTTAIVNVVAAPEAKFSLPAAVAPGLAVTLDASDSVSDDQINNYRWEIQALNGGEPIQLSGESTQFIPQEPGEYSVVLTIETDNDAGCASNSLSRTLVVNHPPVLSWNLPEQWPQYSPLRLSAEGSTDKDGFIRKYTWKVNGEEIGEGITSWYRADEKGLFEIELIAEDNARVENSRVVKTGTIVVQPAPKPEFSIPDIVFAGEEVRLLPASNQDVAGNSLTTGWEIDGERINANELVFIADEPRYEIKLIQENNFNLSNSKAKISGVLHVIMPPAEPQITLPYHIVAGYTLSESMLMAGEHIYLQAGGEIVSNYRLTDALPGDRNMIEVNVPVVWAPRGVVLKTYERKMVVYRPLEANNSSIRKEFVFNPLNNNVRVSAPAVNRPDEHPLRYIWRRAGEPAILAEGVFASLPLRPGTNEFELSISDALPIAGSKPINVQFVIEATLAGADIQADR